MRDDTSVSLPQPDRDDHGGSWTDTGEEPDFQWALANERTLLAYVRTALSLLVGGLAIAASHAVTDAPAWLAALGLPLIALSAAVSLSARERFYTTQRAMRLREPLPIPRVASVLPWGVAMVAALALVLGTVVVAYS